MTLPIALISNSSSAASSATMAGPKCTDPMGRCCTNSSFKSIKDVPCTTCATEQFKKEDSINLKGKYLRLVINGEEVDTPMYKGRYIPTGEMYAHHLSGQEKDDKIAEIEKAQKAAKTAKDANAARKANTADAPPSKYYARPIPDKTGVLHSCVIGDCPRLAHRTVTGLTCTMCAIEDLVEEGDLWYDGDTDSYIGQNPETGEFWVARKNCAGQWVLPFDMLSKYVRLYTPGQLDERRAMWEKNLQSRTDRRRHNEEKNPSLSAQAMPTAEFLQETQSDCDRFRGEGSEYELLAVSKGRRRLKTSKLYNDSLVGHEGTASLTKEVRNPAVLIIEFEPAQDSEKGNYVKVNDVETDKFVKVEDGLGEYVRRGRCIKRTDFEKGGILAGRLRSNIIADGTENEALHAEQALHEENKDGRRAYTLIGGGERIGKRGGIFAVELVACKVLDLTFSDDPVCVFSADMSPFLRSHYEVIFKDHGINSDHFEKPNFNQHIKYREYQRERAAERRAVSDIIYVLFVTYDH